MDDIVKYYVGNLFKKIQGIGSASNTVAFVTEIWQDHNDRRYIKYELYSDSPLVCYAGQESSSPIDLFETNYQRIN